ncbi:MAG: hypothetical protein Q4B09_00480 [Lachnospiraceae bacterium]|nr:hypothetical protein [Lachnospiraceae bacterium]
MKRKNIAMILALAAMMTLAGCGGRKAAETAASTAAETGSATSSTAADTNAPAVDAAAPAAAEASGDVVVPTEEIQNAVTMSETLSSGSYILLEDGSILVNDSFSYHNMAGDMAKLSNLKRIVYSSGNMQELALSNEGVLYFHDQVLFENVADAQFTTTNANIQLYLISDNKVYCGYSVGAEEKDLTQYPGSAVSGEDAFLVYEYRKDQFTNGKTENNQLAEGDYLRLSPEKGTMFLLTKQGRAFVSGGVDYMDEAYADLAWSDWDNLAVIDASKDMLTNWGDSEKKFELTVAGIQADGTVLAVGDYAEEIQSWGKLNYISMDSGLIAGLLPDGTVKIAGRAAIAGQEAVSKLSNIIGLRAGTASGDNVLQALDAEGTHFYIIWKNGQYEAEPDVYQFTVYGFQQGNGANWTRFDAEGKEYWVADGTWKEKSN